MQQLRLVSKAPKVQYTETDAANMLGITVEELRELVRDHIVKGDELPEQSATFRPSDILVLRFLAGKTGPVLRRVAS